jgi:outer membrane protein W
VLLSAVCFSNTAASNDTDMTVTVTGWDKAYDIVVGQRPEKRFQVGVRATSANSLKTSAPMGFEFSKPKLGQVELFWRWSATEKWAVECAYLIGGDYSQKLDFYGANLGEVGISNSPSVAVKLTPFGDWMIRPYCAFGVLYTNVVGGYAIGGVAFETTGDGWRTLWQVGADLMIPVAKKFGVWSINIDYKECPFKTTTTIPDVGTISNRNRSNMFSTGLVLHL